MEFDNMPKFDLSYANNMTQKIQRDIEESAKRQMEIADEAYKERRKMQDALERTAENTGETNLQLAKVVENQNKYIEILQEQLAVKNKQLEYDEKQLDILKNIFASGEDAVAVEKEIMKLIQEQIDSEHPLWEYVKDKGGDIAVAGITVGPPVLYSAIKTWLASKGIVF